MPTFSFLVSIEAPDGEAAKTAHATLVESVVDHNNAGAFPEDVRVDVFKFGEDHERAEKIREMAREEHGRDGELEFDDGCVVSEGDDNGAYVMAWRWVDFGGTEFDKHADGDPDEVVVEGFES
jgi:hypothetical protein